MEIDSQTLDAVCSYFKPFKAKRNEILLNYNQVSRHYYFINKGSIRLFTNTQEGHEISRYFAFEGNFVTALPSFIDQQPAEEFMQAIESSELLRISREDFYHLVDTMPGFTKIYTEILELGFIVAQKRIYGFQGSDAMQKVRWIIQNQPKILVRVSNKLAASYLGISPSTLSRIKAKL
ncbi:CRP-like cAMP-binding protein [Arcticibacter pallidicorallinus]|uniref:CRP-like cAMP-binding protein n=2 Tax=Arcticibacter pallidicorallinus TaxID=1259464 RepID=A0A2T0TYU5_9SPHI|nr:CRP-like cAMP-binding protein [Arcticibacter pallidicorallinus]